MEKFDRVVFGKVIRNAENERDNLPVGKTSGEFGTRFDIFGHDRVPSTKLYGRNEGLYWESNERKCINATGEQGGIV